MRLPRMTTRRWIIAVATLGVMMGIARMAVRAEERRNKLLREARYCIQMENNWFYNNFVLQIYCLVYQNMIKTKLDSDPGFTRKALAVYRLKTERSAAWVEYYKRKGRECAYLADRPWLATPTELPPPGEVEEVVHFLELPASMTRPAPTP